MPEEKKQPSMGVAQRNAGHKYQPGHEKFGGRKKRTAQMARDLADELGCDPLRFMMQVIQSDVIEQAVIDDKGKVKRVKIAVDLATRLDAAKNVANYLYPRLNSTAVTGANDGPVELATLDLTPFMSDPTLARAAQEAVIQALEADAARIEAERGPQPKLLEAEYTD
jgi:hypothetical protein